MFEGVQYDLGPLGRHLGANALFPKKQTEKSIKKLTKRPIRPYPEFTETDFAPVHFQVTVSCLKMFISYGILFFEFPHVLDIPFVGWWGGEGVGGW